MNIRVKLTRPQNAPLKTVAMPLEEYLRGVVPVELLRSWVTPPYGGLTQEQALELAKAQTVAARTYAARKVLRNQRSKRRDYDVDDTTRYQAYKKHREEVLCDQAIAETAGIILTYDGQLIDAVFTSSNGGHTVKQPDGWGTEPYFPDAPDPFDAMSGRPCKGHGAGLSQFGAFYRAKTGHAWQDILAFYYPGTGLETLPSDSVDDPPVDVSDAPIICLDPGHRDGYNRYGHLPDGTPYAEGTAMRDLAMRLQDAIPGVILTREGPDDVKLSQRGKFAAQQDADILISLHTNSGPETTDKAQPGILIFYSVDLPEDRALAHSLAQLLSQHTGIAIRNITTRPSRKYPGEDYYTVIDSAQDHGVPHVLLVEHGSHWQFAADYDRHMAGCVQAYQAFFRKHFHVVSDAVEEPVEPPTADKWTQAVEAMRQHIDTARQAIEQADAALDVLAERNEEYHET